MVPGGRSMISMKRRLCWNNIRGLLQLHPSRSADLRIVTRWWDRVKRLEPVNKSWRPRSANVASRTILTAFSSKQCSTIFEVFLTNWRPLAAKPSEQLISNWCGLVPLVTQFNWANQVFDIRCNYEDITSRIRYLRKISEFDEKAKLLEWKTSAVKATSFAFGSLTDSKEVMG